MSSYATPTDLALYGGVAAGLTGISTPMQQSAIDSASTLADGYLRAKFTLPLSAPFPTDLTEAVCKIAYYTLLSSRGYNPETGSDTNIRDRYKDAIAWLTGISKGVINPSAVDASPGSDGGPFVLQPVLSSDGSSIVASAPVARGW